MRRRSSIYAFLVALAAGLAAAPPPCRAQTDVTRTSRPIRLLRSWEDTVKVGDQEIPRRVEVLFDYARGVAYQNSYNEAGVRVSSLRITRGFPRPSEEEVAEAIGLLRSDGEFAPILGRFPDATVEGGFRLEEGKGKPCGPGHRCLQLQLRSSYNGTLLRRVVVDLASRSIAYRNHVPTPGGAK